jgi:hypothetical protein
MPVAPPKRAELAQPESGPERHIEETDGNEIRFITERIERRHLDQRGADCVCVLGRDLLATEVLRGRKVGPRRRVGVQLPLPHRVGEHLAQRRDDVSHRAGRLALCLQSGDEGVDVVCPERGKRSLPPLCASWLVWRSHS